MNLQQKEKKKATFRKVDTNKKQLETLIAELKSTPPPKDAPVLPDPSTALKSIDPGDLVCEPDEYAQFVAELKASGLIKDHRKGVTSYKKSFSGKEFVNWVVREKGLSREVAVEMGQELIDSHFGRRVKGDEEFHDDDVYYRLLEDADISALNGGNITTCEPRDAPEVSEDLRKLILKLHSAFLSKDGKKVDYNGIKKSAEFETYKRLAKELQRVNIEDCTTKEKLAFFINIYNALVIHANIEKGPPANLWQRYKFFNTARYLVGGYEYSLQDMENGVLRANRKGVGMLTKPFGSGDPRLNVALDNVEPLIHFGLVCGAKSCPPIKTYTAEEVIEQLGLAAEAFLDGSDGCMVDGSKKQVALSMIFKWYREDFGSTDEAVLEWIHSHMENGETKQQLRKVLDGKKFKVMYMKYDWSSNAK